jgi:site-specific DNA recombinase
LRELIIPGPIMDWLAQELVTKDLTERATHEQDMRRDQAELERLQERLDMIYEDRLDGRIDASTYDQKAAEIRERKERVKRRVSERQGETLPTATQAVELLAVMSKAADLFLEQSVTEQRKLLRLVLESSSWKGGELRMCLREPFSQLRLSNLASQTKDNNLSTSSQNIDTWRRGGDSNPR